MILISYIYIWKRLITLPTDYSSGSAPGEADLIGSAKGKSDFKLLQHEDEYICSQAQIVFVWTCDWCYHLLFRCYFKHGEQYCCQRSWRRHRDEWYGQHAIYAYNTLLFSYFTVSRVNIIKAIQISQKVRVWCKCKIKTICGFNLKPYHANIKKYTKPLEICKSFNLQSNLIPWC